MRVSSVCVSLTRFLAVVSMLSDNYALLWMASAGYVHGIDCVGGLVSDNGQNQFSNADAPSHSQRGHGARARSIPLLNRPALVSLTSFLY